jgi:orotate phosphoribosyltransferase
MGQWVLGLSQHHRIDGLLVPASDARLLAEGMETVIKSRMPVRVVYAPFDAETGKIGTEVSEDAIRKGENFVVINDVTTRGNCVNKLGTIVNDHGGHVAGMMVFARRDSGQFPFVDDLMSRYPFYYGTKLMMPQWEVQSCPNCQRGEEFFSWREMPV